MLKKKLLTLACAVGILACGACMNTWTPPPTPPLAPEIKASGIHSIGVEVINVSPSRHIDPSTLARSLVGSINVETKKTTVKAHTRKEPGTEDAVLKIAILDESVTHSPPQAISWGQLWTIHLSLSTTLTQKDGKVLWQEKEGNYQVPGFSRDPGQANPQYQWKDSDWRYSNVAENLTFDLKRRILFAEPPRR